MKTCPSCGHVPPTRQTYCDKACYTSAQSSQPVRVRFWSKVEIRTDGCWQWMGGQFGRSGTQKYGQFWWNGRRWLAHVVAYVLAHGPVPTGLEVQHTCPNPLCVRPAHLKTGTRRDSVRAWRKRQAARKAA